MVFPRISSIFDPQAIFSVEILPGGGHAHHKVDCILLLHLLVVDVEYEVPINIRLSNPFNVEASTRKMGLVC